jgi:zinc transport system ATP-binding protein
VSFGDKTALDKVNLHLNCREILALVGPNGAGKTTLLRAMLGEISYQGEMHYQLQGQSSRKPLIGYVPQKLNFDPDAPISVEDFFTASISDQPVWLKQKASVRNQVDKALEQVSAEGLKEQRLATLSGGQLQRVLLAMAITPVPDILLLDEPISGVDPKGLVLFYQIVNNLKEQYDISIIMATHDLLGVANYAQRMVLINKKIIADGTPNEVLADTKTIQMLAPDILNISKYPEMAYSKDNVT